MGYSYQSIQKVLKYKSAFNKKRVLTLGTIYPFITNKEAKKLVQAGVGLNVPKEAYSKHLFVDVLGASICHSLDVSDYQQSEIICNLNFPIPTDLASQYDVIIDAGTLEHLSDLSTALKNLFNLLRKDGIYYFSVPCNNWPDHGFFQFSPTFFIDLCNDNPDLELVELSISIENNSYDLKTINPFWKQALLASNKRLGVSGIIKKTGESINLNLIQSKYKNEYSPINRNGDIRRPIRKLLSSILLKMAKSHFLPLNIKKVIFDLIYVFKRK